MRYHSVIDFGLTVIWLLAAIELTIRVYSLRFSPPSNEFLFWVPYLVIVSISAYMALTKKGYLPFIFAIGTALVLHSIPVLRQPGNILWGKDQVHDLQIAKLGLSNGNFQFGNPVFHSHSYDQSLYPGLEFLTSSINLLSNISLVDLYNYSFVFIGLLTLVFLYFLMRRIVKSSIIVNVAVLLYVFCPGFNGFNSGTVHESLAIIFFPLVLAFLLTEFREKSDSVFQKKLFLVAAISTFLVSITNEFAIYVLTFMSAVIVCSYLWVERTKKATIITRNDLYKISLAVMCLVSMLGWLFFVASYYTNLHSGIIDQVILALTGNLNQSMRAPSSSLPFAQTILTYAGLGTLFTLSFVGAYFVVRQRVNSLIKNVNHIVLVIWWFSSAAMMVLFEVIPWSEIGEGPIRFRSIEFSYFGLVPMASIGLYLFFTLTRKHSLGVSDWKHRKLFVTILLIALISIPTVYSGFSRYYYDNPPLVDMHNLNSVEAFYSATWLSQHVDTDIIAGTEDGDIWVSGVAAIPFSYSDFRTTIINHTIIDNTYYVNLANVNIPDQNKMIIGPDNMTWLYSNFDTVYNSGSVVVLTLGDND